MHVTVCVLLYICNSPITCMHAEDHYMHALIYMHTCMSPTDQVYLYIYMHNMHVTCKKRHACNSCMYKTCSVPLELHACKLYMHMTGEKQACIMRNCHNMHARYRKHACYMYNISSRVFFFSL